LLSGMVVSCGSLLHTGAGKRETLYISGFGRCNRG
jgi:hypothetical protein